MSKRSTVLTAALASILVLSGCAAPGTDLLPVVVDNPDDDLKPVEVGNPDDDLLPVKVGDPADDLLPVESKNKQGKDCLPGTWLLSNASWKALIDANAGAQGVTVEVPTGSVLLTFSDTATYSVEYAGWDIRMKAEDGTIQMHRQGKDSGSYSATASRVTLTESATGSSVTGSIQTSQGTIPLPAGMASQSSFVQSFSYTCKASALTATVPEGTLALSRN
jgi:hypothetical protein